MDPVPENNHSTSCNQTSPGDLHIVASRQRFQGVGARGTKIMCRSMYRSSLGQGTLHQPRGYWKDRPQHTLKYSCADETKTLQNLPLCSIYVDTMPGRCLQLPPQGSAMAPSRLKHVMQPCRGFIGLKYPVRCATFVCAKVYTMCQAV